MKPFFVLKKRYNNNYQNIQEVEIEFETNERGNNKVVNLHAKQTNFLGIVNCHRIHLSEQEINHKPFPFPPEKELKEMCQKLSAPNYPYVNYVLPDNANSNERMKYSLCKTILRYQREKELSDPQLAKRLGVSKDKLIDILFAKVYNLELNELLTYFEILLIKTSESEKIKSLLDQNKTDYEIVYKETIDLTEEEIWRRDTRLAAQDKERNKEIAEWDRIQAQDDAKLNKNDDD
ncbi:41290_t:CDS:2 [Gigaspora margarita]|uniref:41290_t:CDS:1 n=1 Tax=Gigaspora margarita TaxID=4874 RepID=A0ABN7UHP6_GIGMA|nr:41290_t:CDS:2 [Gigaspora margarita]